MPMLVDQIERQDLAQNGRPKQFRQEFRKGREYQRRNPSNRNTRPRSQSGRGRSGSVGSNGHFQGNSQYQGNGHFQNNSHFQGNSQGHSRRNSNNNNYFNNFQRVSSIQGVTEHLRGRYDRQTMKLIERYIDDTEANVEVTNTSKFLRRCRDNGLIPKDYWMNLPGIRNTRDVKRLLDKCSYQLMQKDLEHNMTRRRQIQKFLNEQEKHLSHALSPRDFHAVRNAIRNHRNELFVEIRNKQRKEYDALRKIVSAYEKQLEKKKQQPSKNPRRRSNGHSESSSRNSDHKDHDEEEHPKVHRRRADSGSSKGHSDDEQS